jgi:hypothetical protein
MKYLLTLLLLAAFCTNAPGASTENPAAQDVAEEDVAEEGEIPEVVEKMPVKKKRGGRFSVRIDAPKPGELGHDDIKSDRYGYRDARRKRYGHDADADGDGLHDALDPSTTRRGYGR